MSKKKNKQPHIIANIFDAIKSNNVQILQDFLQGQTSPLETLETRNQEGYNPLDFAVKNSNAAVVTTLLNNGAWLMAQGYEENHGEDGTYERKHTALHFAAERGDINIMRAVLDEAYHQNKLQELLESKDEKGNTAVHLAVMNNNFNCTQELLDKGAKINEANHNGRTPLHIAVEKGKGKAETVKELLKRGSDISQKDFEGNTALHEAVTKNCLKCVKEIVSAARDRGNLREILEIKNEDKKTASELAQDLNNTPISNYIEESNFNAAYNTYRDNGDISHILELSDNLNHDLFITKFATKILTDKNVAPTQINAILGSDQFKNGAERQKLNKLLESEFNPSAFQEFVNDLERLIITIGAALRIIKPQQQDASSSMIANIHIANKRINKATSFVNKIRENSKPKDISR